MRCRLCDTCEESELHLLACDEVLDDSIRNMAESLSINDFWSSFSKQKNAIKLFNKIMKIRNMKYEKKKLTCQTQANPGVPRMLFSI